MVNFLDGLPLGRSRRCARSLQRLERLHLEADHLCVDYAEGVARSRLTPAFLDKALQVPATGRNWNTTNKMLDTGARTFEAQTGSGLPLGSGGTGRPRARVTARTWRPPHSYPGLRCQDDEAVARSLHRPIGHSCAGFVSPQLRISVASRPGVAKG